MIFLAQPGSQVVANGKTVREVRHSWIVEGGEEADDEGNGGSCPLSERA
jgi:hypothetical protein